MQIWLRGSGNTLRLPVLPSEYSVTGKQNNTVVTVNGFGEVLLKGRRGLFEVSFSCFFLPIANTGDIHRPPRASICLIR